MSNKHWRDELPKEEAELFPEPSGIKNMMIWGEPGAEVWLRDPFDNNWAAYHLFMGTKKKKSAMSYFRGSYHTLREINYILEDRSDVKWAQIAVIRSNCLIWLAEWNRDTEQWKPLWK